MKVTFIVLTTAAITLYAGVVNAFDHLRIKKELLSGRIVPDGKIYILIFAVKKFNFLL